MKKILSLVLTAAMLAGMCSASAFADETEAPVELASLEFTSGGSVISGPAEGTVKAAATVKSDGAQKISLYLAAYDTKGGIASIDLASAEFAEGETKVIETPAGVEATSASQVRAFVWKSNLEPVADDVELGSQAVLLDAAITVGDYTYEGVVDSTDKKVTFYIPSGKYLDEVNALKGLNPPAVTPEINAVKYTLAAVGSAAIAGTAVTSETAFDADTVSTIAVTSADGTTTENYAVEHKFVLAERRYDSTDAAYSNGYFTQLNAGNAKAGNVSASVVTVAAKEQEGDTFAVVTEDDNTYINMTKTNTSQYNNVQFRGSTINDVHENDHVKTTFRFRLNSTDAAAGTAFAYINHGGYDQSVIVKTGDETFVLNNRAHTGDNSAGTKYEYCPELKFGQWYEYTTVLDKGDYENGYIVKAYIDGKYIGSCANSGSGLTATFDRSVGIDMSFSAFTASQMNVDVDDLEVYAVMNKDAFEGKTTVHLLGDSITRYYSTNSKNQQGWGPSLTEAFNSETTRVLNHSVGGYNSNIYLNGANRDNLKSDPIWQSIKRYLKAGDYVVIAVGRNENNATDGTKSTAAFTANLKTLADDCAAYGAIPVFVNAIPALSEATADEVTTYGVDNWITFGSGFRAAKDMKYFATQNGYTILDINSAMYHKMMDMSSDELLEHFLTDRVHTTEKGAVLVTELLVKLISESDSTLKAHLAVSYDSANAYVKSATATIGDVTYKADVNHDRNTVMFESVISPKSTTASHPDLTSVEVVIEANGTSSLASTVDLTENQTFTVTNGDDVETYTIGFEKAAYVRTYGSGSIKNRSTTDSTAARRGAPDYDSQDKGYGGWFVLNQIYDLVYAEDGTTVTGAVFNEENSYGTVNVQTDSQDSTNKLIKLNKTKAGKALNVSSNAGESPASNSKISVEFKVRVNSLEAANGNAPEATLYINTAQLDQILITRAGAADNKYYIGYRPNADDNSIMTYSVKALDFGEWHTVKYVFRKDTTLEAGYTMEIYLDGEFVTETDFKNRTSSSGEYILPDGNIKNWPSAFTDNKSQIAIRSFSNTIADIDFDNFVITSIAD